MKIIFIRDITVAKFLTEVRRHIKLNQNDALFIFVNNNVTPQGNASMHQGNPKKKPRKNNNLNLRLNHLPNKKKQCTSNTKITMVSCISLMPLRTLLDIFE